MLVLAIDPGSTRSGWVVYNYAAKRVLDAGDDDNMAVCRKVIEYSRSLGTRLVVEAFASHGQASMGAASMCDQAVRHKDWSLVSKAAMMARTGATAAGNMVEAACWLGMFCAAAGQTPATVAKLTRKDVLKAMHIASKGADAAVRAELIRHFGAGSEKKGGALAVVKGDAWQALGLAVVYAAQVEKDNQADEVIRKGTL